MTTEISLGLRGKRGKERRLGETTARTAGGGARRLPDLSALPPLLASTGSFAGVRERLGPPGGVAGGGSEKVGRHVGLAAVPHGAKTYLAAALALAPDGERLVWIARDAEIGDRVAEELGAWLGDADVVAVLEPRTALAYERSELVADETAARVAALSAWKSGQARILVASVQALVQHTIGVEDLPAEPRRLRVGGRLRQDALLRELLALGYAPAAEVAGRGEFARRGGIVDIFPPSAPLPVRLELFGDEIDSLRAFDPTDQRTVGPLDETILLPASEFLAPAGGAAALRERLGRSAAKLPERLAADLTRFEGEPGDDADGTSGGPGATRAIAVGDAAEVWAAQLAPATGFDHLDPGTLLVLDEPGEIAEAAGFLWRQADERRAELIESGDLPKDWPSTYLGPRDWKRRLVAGRTLELTWESEMPAAAALAARGLSSGDPFGWREPQLPPARAAAIVEAVERWQRDGARVVLASDQAPRLAELLDEAGHPAGVVHAPEVPPPGAIALVERSLNGGFEGGPDGLAFVTDRELFGTVRVRRPKAMRRVVPRDILERLTPGDLVVHIDHGVARYEQMLRRGNKSEGEDRDYLELSFAGGDKIFVPVEQITRISRYSGADRPQLSKLGGTEWLRTKQRVRKAVADLAEELLELYATRANSQGHAYAPDTPWQSEMEASFPYEETPDQLRAVAEVKLDMEAGRPMDRLVVGDVGYGKT
ncbi:MAG TPA: CarD family transcriptional regulator, partial [Candidatus Limnocylindrales bacterium]